MKKTIWVAALFAAASCGGKAKTPATGAGMSSGTEQSEKISEPAPSADPVTTAATGPAPPPMPPQPPPPPPKAPDQLADIYLSCWSAFNAQKWDDFKACYASDATSSQPGSGIPDFTGADAIVADAKNQATAFPDTKGELQLVLQNGTHTVGIAVLTGTNTGPLTTPMGEVPPTKKKFGVLFGHSIDFNDQGVATKENAYWDLAAMLSQVGVSKVPSRKALTKGWAKQAEIVLARNDDAEKANVAVFAAAIDGFNKHDVKAFGDTLAKNVLWVDLGSPKDFDQKGAIADTKMFWKGFSDVKISPDQMWGAGPYVVMTGMIGGTNDGDVPAMHLKKSGKSFSSPFMHIVKIENGKIVKSWIFYQTIGFAAQLGLLPPAPPAKK